ncbi:MAG: histidine phosphotransferase family protein [Ahrensia sp.]|nr:histidine phosphotransferase family protein [Ahrensia sp.]
MPNLPELSALDVAALLASRVCHDIISPVGALANGLEVLEEDQGEEMREFAMELISKSAKSASAKLKFSRVAFGASGSAGSSIDSGEAEEVVRGYMDGEKAEMTWEGTRSLVPKNRIKLLLNLILLGIGAIPRGGNLGIQIHGEGETATFTIRCAGIKARVPSDFLDLLNGTIEEDITAHVIQPYYTIMLAQECGLELSAKAEGEDVVFSAS